MRCETEKKDKDPIWDAWSEYMQVEERGKGRENDPEEVEEEEQVVCEGGRV